MDWKAFRTSRDLARQCGALPEKFEEVVRKNGILPESLAFCRKCWEAKDPASMSRQTEHTCCSCDSDRNAKWNRHAQQRTVSAGASRNGEPWDDRDIRYLREHVKTDTLEKIAISLHRTRDAVNQRCSLLGLFEDRHEPEESVPITDYTICRNISPSASPWAEHQVGNGRIAVWCHADTSDAEIEMAFLVAKIPHSQFVVWRSLVRPV